MSDGTTADPVESAVVDAPDTGALEADTTATGLLDSDEAETGEQAQPVDDGEEIEFDGEKFKVPKKLKDGFLMHADYTRKTQEVAEARRAIEAQQTERQAQYQAQEAALREQQEFQQKHIKDVATVLSIDERLAQFAKLDWDAITNADPVQALKLERQVRELQGEKQAALQKITQAQQQQNFERQQLTARQQQEVARNREASLRELEQSIQGYSTPEVQKGLKEAAKAIGFKDEELANVSDPRAVKLLHKAYLYDQLVAKAKAKPKEEQAKPVTRVGAKTSSAVVDEDKLSPDEWRKHREAQVAARNKAR